MLENEKKRGKIRKKYTSFYANLLENEKKGEKLEKITWFLKGQGRIRIRIRIRKFITDPDPDPRGQKNTDP